MNKINFCILHAKWFIHTKKNKNIDVNFDTFLKYLKGVIVIEEQIAVNNKSMAEFLKMFNAYKIYLT